MFQSRRCMTSLNTYNVRKYKTWFKATIVFHRNAKTRYAGKVRKAELCFSAGREWMEATPMKAISRWQQKPRTCTRSALGFTPWPLASFHSQQPHLLRLEKAASVRFSNTHTHREAYKASQNNSFKQHEGGKKHIHEEIILGPIWYAGFRNAN